MSKDGRMNCYTFHFDGGHGWLAVPASDAHELGVEASAYSYQSPDGRLLYLEEDCDASQFLVKYEDRHGTKPTIVERNDGAESPIRSLERAS